MQPYFKNSPTSSHRSDLVICHQNIRALKAKTRRLEVMLETILKCDVLCLTEHWLKDFELNCIHLFNYSLSSYYCRTNIEHGGACIYVNNRHKFKEFVLNISVQQVCEIAAVELIDYNTIVVCVYRSNKTKTSDFFPIFEALLDLLNNSDRECIVVGDFNINWLCPLNSDLKKLIDILNTRNFFNIVDFPTRVTSETSTCLDHIYVNNEIARSGMVRATPLHSDLSDHYAVRAVIDCESPLNGSATYRTRSYSQANTYSFIGAIDSVDWLAVAYKYVKSSLNDLTTAILNIIVNKIDACFPVKCFSSHKKNTSWVSNNVIALEHLIREMSEISQSFPDNATLSNQIDDFKDRFDKVLREERSKYYCDIIAKSGNSAKTMWDIVKLETGKTRTSLDFIKSLRKHDGSEFRSDSDAVDAVNTHFVNAAATCCAPPACVSTAMRALRSSSKIADTSLRFKFFTPAEVFKIIQVGVSHKNTKDIYEISTSLLHKTSESLACILCILFNRCIKEGEYPQVLKRVRVSPLYKGKGRKEDVNSYRPVSIIPAIAKILENGLSTRLLDYLSSTASLSTRQYAYRAGRSTTDAAREVVRHILEARECKNQVAVLFCDLSKAFDVADHALLVEKLAHYGICGPALQLIASFLSNRYQVVTGRAGKIRSQALPTSIGVPQGSSLSNIVFSLLMNDLPAWIKDAHVFMYADDVAAVVEAPTVNELEARLTSVASQLHQWFSCNGLVLNVTKTNFIHFNLAGRAYRPLNVGIDGKHLGQVNETVFLGFTLDRTLTWELHINTLSKKIGRACFALWRLSSTLNRNMVRSLYFASVHSHLQYGVDLWGCAADWERAFRLQKRAVRAVVRVSQNTSARPYFKSLGIMTVPALVIYQAALYVQSHLEEYSRCGDGQRYDLRHAKRLRTIDHKLAKSGKLVHMLGPRVYNRLPPEITSAPSMQSFKHKLKTWLIDMCFYDINELIIMKMN